MKHDQYVLPNDEKWVVVDDTGFENANFFKSMMDAIRYAHTFADRYHAEVIVYKYDSNVLGPPIYVKNPEHM